VKSQLRTVNDHGVRYTSLVFVCPGCVAGARDNGYPGYEGLHMLPVNSPNIGKPSWDFDGNFDLPTLSPSILTKGGYLKGVCHSFLKEGIFQFLSDCDHPLKDQFVPIPDLPEWAVKLD
jgi:hypothetical protein